MTMPNFFIVGAAKAGTSSLFNYITQHPEVYNTPLKEPCYFAFKGQDVCFTGPGDENLNRSVITKREEYLALFDGVTNEKAIGEASVVYLCDENAPYAIREEVPDAKIIIVLRSPADRAYSSYMHKIRDGFESEGSFRRALMREGERDKAGWQHIWMYSKLSFYADSLQRYQSLFPKNNIRVFLFDDLQNDIPSVLRSVFDFLGVDPSFSVNFSRKYNVSAKPKSPVIQRLLKGDSKAKQIFKNIFPHSFRSQLRTTIEKFNLDEKYMTMPSEEKKYLISLFYDDVKKTEQLTNKDLSTWYRL